MAMSFKTVMCRMIKKINYTNLKILSIYMYGFFQIRQWDLPLNFPTSVHLVSYRGVKFSTTGVTPTTGQCSRVQVPGSISSMCRWCRILKMVAFISTRIHKNLLLPMLARIHNITELLHLLPCG